MSDYFEGVVSFDELIRKIRGRFQMWVGDDLSALSGFLVGFSCARPSINFDRMRQFERYILSKAGHSADRDAMSAVRSMAQHPIASIPIFFELFEEFSGVQSTETKTVHLSSRDQDNFLLEGIQGFARRGIPAPECVSLLVSDFWSPHIRYIKDGRTLYEISTGTEDRAIELMSSYIGA